MPGVDERLKTYGLSAGRVALEDVTVRSGEIMTLNSKSRVGHYENLETNSFKTLKSWIGVRNETVKENPHIMERASMNVSVPGNLKPMMRQPATGRSVVMPNRVLLSMKQQVKPLAAQYLYGNSATLQKAEMILESIWKKINIGIYLLQTIEVQAGAVLDIGTDIQVLWASRLKIHDGGLVRIHLGNTFKLDVDVLEKV